MNTYQLLQHCFLAVSLVGAAVCFFAVLAYYFRNQIRELHERWLGLGPLGRFVSILAVTVAVLYGGTKSTTNEVTGTGVVTNDVSGVVLAGGSLAGGSGSPCPSAFPGTVARSGTDRAPSCLSVSFGLTNQLTNQQLTTLPNWTARGAYSDWQRIDFPDGFAFPYGTNLLSSVTLFAWGEIRESLVGSSVCSFVGSIDASSTNQLTDQPTNQLTLSLEPGTSSVTYGLTSSNSFLIAWQNACVNRDATNRVDASIELFRSGVILITTQPTNQPTNKQTNYLAPEPPPGFIGNGQDDAWALAAFPDDYDAITNKGYEAWLMEDKVGINVENGLYKAAITVGEIPTNEPCYLVCGPYKVVLKAPGTYSFPLEVFEHYEARTYPTAVPLSVEYDDGYRGEAASDMLMSSPTHAPKLMGSRPLILPIYFPASFYATPNQIELSQAVGAVIQLWCNFSSACQSVWQSESSTTLIGWLPPSRAEIKRVLDADLIVFRKITGKGESQCTVSIVPNSHCCCGSCTGADCTCGCDCTNHHSGTNAPPTTGSEP